MSVQDTIGKFSQQISTQFAQDTLPFKTLIDNKPTVKLETPSLTLVGYGIQAGLLEKVANENIDLSNNADTITYVGKTLHRTTKKQVQVFAYFHGGVYPLKPIPYTPINEGDPEKQLAEKLAKKLTVELEKLAIV